MDYCICSVSSPAITVGIKEVTIPCLVVMEAMGLKGGGAGILICQCRSLNQTRKQAEEAEANLEWSSKGQGDRVL